MTINITCLRDQPPLGSVPLIANQSPIAVHANHASNTNGLAQLISSALTRSIFSIDDVRALITDLRNKTSNPWDAASLVRTKPALSVIIYSSVTVALILMLSLIFCLVSCLNLTKRNYAEVETKRKRRRKRTWICIGVLVTVYLLGLADMIYAAVRVHRAKSPMDEAIRAINDDVYPREISEHVHRLIGQLEIVAQYCSQPDSILIRESKSILLKWLHLILQDHYFIDEISSTIDRTDHHMRKLTDLFNTSPGLSPLIVALFHTISQQYTDTINHLQGPLNEICRLTQGADSTVDTTLLSALDFIHRDLQKLIDTIRQKILRRISPWQDHRLMSADVEDRIRTYLDLATTLVLVLVIVVAIIPWLFLVLVGVSRLLAKEADKRRAKIDRFTLFGIRIAFGGMFILLVLLALATGAFFSLDLVLQGACRSAHDDQGFLISTLTDVATKAKFLDQSNGTSNTNAMITNMIGDCQSRVHFSDRLLTTYGTQFDSSITETMKSLNKKVFDQFLNAIKDIDIAADIHLLSDLLNKSTLVEIANEVRSIDEEFNTMKGVFAKIESWGGVLPMDLIHTIITEFQDHVRKIIESTMDACPLPFTTILKVDTLLCDRLAGSVNGLWLSLFFFIIIIVLVGLCILGLGIYKRLI